MDRRRFIQILIGGGLAGLGVYYISNFIEPMPGFDVDDLVFDVDIVGEELVIPWSIEVLDDDIYLVSERIGRLTLVDSGVKTVVAEYDVAVVGEAGLLGIVKHPDFDLGRRYIYIYMSYYRGDEIFNRVSRLRLSRDYRSIESIEPILDGIPGAYIHDGGRIRFGPDGYLYICTGDANIPSLSQDIDSLAGKILRVYDDGEPVDDNPFNNHVYSYGHRNPQGLDWHPIDKRFLSNEHGPIGHDEINEIVRGGNYGWPIVVGYSDDERFIPPLYETGQNTIAPSGASFIDGKPFKMDGYVYVIACLRGERLAIFNPIEGSLYSIFNGVYGRLRDIKYLGDSTIIFSTSNRDGRGFPQPGDDRLIKITFR